MFLVSKSVKRDHQEILWTDRAELSIFFHVESSGNFGVSFRKYYMKKFTHLILYLVTSLQTVNCMTQDCSGFHLFPTSSKNLWKEIKGKNYQETIEDVCECE